MVQKKFGALRFVSGLFKVLAWIFLILGILGAIGALIVSIIAAGSSAGSSASGLGSILAGGIVTGILAFIGLIIFALIQFVVLMAVSEIYQIFVAVEYNTRETAYLMRGEQQQPGVMAPPPMR